MTPRTPRGDGFRLPAETDLHAGVWIAWPSHDDLWQPHLGRAQEEVVGLIRAIQDPDEDGHPRGERVHLLVLNGGREVEARALLGENLDVRYVRMRYGDIWMRDIGPLFLRDDAGRVGSVCFAFNGWGGKYLMDGDAEVAGRLAELHGGPLYAMGMVCEGGALEVDGEGTVLTTRSCLLNPNRNPGWEEATVEARLRDALGVEAVRWLDEGLAADHTDGHIDTLARFVEPGRVVCMAPSGDDDPNRTVLETLARALGALKDARGRTLQVERIPSPGRVEDHEGTLMPASYMNFYVANRTVVVPTYGAPWDDEAVARLQTLFPDRRVVGRPAKTILLGGGAFHCITQQVPKGADEVEA